ncbi:mucosa-associated lymphoid tissue lymphoma translocation protein 1-like isoform X2 [Phasianus colchicus]|uniref:mucosa-associated lymphoid tissue lymphoma translocation protein 1-like isoform X2 n=1 Tax=Phasianus colchicus TaxID=9054 RepID=UPI00129E2F71|nr:mucosa-associated lymphoid tissue lymphoma translocation protein 1-like isoform X2 [Phasianus colchicus]
MSTRVVGRRGSESPPRVPSAWQSPVVALLHCVGGWGEAAAAPGRGCAGSLRATLLCRAGSGRGKQKCCSVGLLLFLTPISSVWGSVCAELGAGGSGTLSTWSPRQQLWGRMGDWSLPISSLGEEVVAQLCELLDTASRGWRKLAEVAGAEKRFKCSEEELEMCSLKVLEPLGSPTQSLLQLLAERECSLRYLRGCLHRMGHTQACQLLSSAVHDVIRITVQPESQAVAEGTRVSLTCWATGPPGLTYQWFCGKQEVPGATAPELMVDTAAAPGLPQWYICRVSCGAAFAFSRWAHIQVERSHSPKSASGYCPSMAGLQILQQPQPCRLAEGDPLVLECRALGNPPPQYQWYRNRRPVEGARAPRLQVQLVTTAERGTYSCRVFNLFHELWSQEVDVEIGPRLFASGAPWQEGDGGRCRWWHCPIAVLGAVATISLFADSPEPGSPDQLYATDKVALLVGNMHYMHHKDLRAPMVDVHALSALLRQLDFKVVSLLDLRRDEMQMAVNEFLLLLDKGVYGLLYYAGHGYENFGTSFMVPIDAPGSYTSAHCLCVQHVLQRMQQRRTGLNIFLLDMCRKRNLNDDILPQVGALEVTANIVFGYATWVPSHAPSLLWGQQDTTPWAGAGMGSSSDISALLALHFSLMYGYAVTPWHRSGLPGMLSSMGLEMLVAAPTSRQHPGLRAPMLTWIAGIWVEDVPSQWDSCSTGEASSTLTHPSHPHRCADAEAYELSQGELSNGVFVTFLKRWLLEDEKITVLLDKVAEDMGTLELTRGRQALELRSNLSERRALTDPIRSLGRAETSARNLQWAKAHVLPESRHLHFDCGVTVQLGFAAEFSNIMIIYTRILAAPGDITECVAKLTDLPEELDVDLKYTNRECPEELGSPLVPTWSLACPSCCLYSRLCGLQRLRELTFTVCLQFRYRGVADFVEELRAVSVGRPLIAKLNLSPRDPGTPPASGGSGSPLSVSPPSSWGNSPEENLSPEVHGSHGV